MIEPCSLFSAHSGDPCSSWMLRVRVMSTGMCFLTFSRYSLFPWPTSEDHSLNVWRMQPDLEPPSAILDELPHCRWCRHSQLCHQSKLQWLPKVLTCFGLVQCLMNISGQRKAADISLDALKGLLLSFPTSHKPCDFAIIWWRYRPIFATNACQQFWCWPFYNTF